MCGSVEIFHGIPILGLMTLGLMTYYVFFMNCYEYCKYNLEFMLQLHKYSMEHEYKFLKINKVMLKIIDAEIFITPYFTHYFLVIQKIKMKLCRDKIFSKERNSKHQKFANAAG